MKNWMIASSALFTVVQWVTGTLMVIHFPFPVAPFSYPIFLFMNRRSQILTGSMLLYPSKKVASVELIWFKLT